MSDQRFIIEMGSGNDQYGMDYTKAAARAIEDAIRHSAIPMLAVRGIDHKQMRVQVTIGVQEPEAIDTEVLKSALPRGHATITATHGGLNVNNPDADSTIVIATAAVEVFLPKQA